MPTLCGLRRRGYTPEAIRHFTIWLGLPRRDNVIDLALFEFGGFREDLNKRATCVNGNFDPFKSNSYKLRESKLSN